MRVRRPLVIGWALLTAGGWAVTIWLGEPTATAGPRPSPSPSSPADAEPGPQPEGPCSASRAGPGATPSPDPSTWSTSVEQGDGRVVQHLCDYAVATR
ncbi:hypothetical protein [Streptomyces sp. NBC_00887]|uniref:hypothetical protein n=1 Tax=Streptomyces sp. NBC_00887 TaxID=2975859 RepID=UPI00386BF608|nr:hypothetical protein OG844_22560 [Streptomyces sp. NBC_00887]